MREPPPFINTEADVDEVDQAIEEKQESASKTTKLKVLVSGIAICSIVFGVTLLVVAKLVESYLVVGNASKALTIGVYGGICTVLLLARYYVWPALARAPWF
jgi:hypothetical protein